MAENKTVLIVGGPTASGKSSFAIDLAKKCDGVVINADSMQIYDGLHMLTAHPSFAEQKVVPHYLYGVLSPEVTCSAASWCEMAKQVVLDAHSNGKLPILTGGTGFYLKAMRDGLSPIPDVPTEVLQATIELCENLGREEFAKRLSERDSEIVKRIDMCNPQRMIRALSVLEATGKSLAYWQDKPRETVLDNVDFVEVVVLPKRDHLYRRCNDRFDWMLDNGVLSEVEAFVEKITIGEIDKNVQLTGALGFKELEDYLAGKCDKETAIDNAKQSTRRYAKRQTTWFNNQMHGNYVVEDTASANEIVKSIISRLQ